MKSIGCLRVLVLGLAVIGFNPRVRGADDTASKLAEYMTTAATKDNFSGAVLVKRAGQALLREAYGQANVELEVPNRVSTKFRLGSITKQFTSMAVMILAEQGKLSIDDPISKHLENTPS